MRIGVEAPDPVHRAQEEADDDLPRAVALLLRQTEHRRKPPPLDPLRHQDASPGQRTHHRGYKYKRMAAVGARKRALLLGLELEVELLEHPLAQLACHDLGVQPRRDGLAKP